MFEGKIIKFYREKLKFTQEQLGKDICSVTHISKIECNRTTYNKEIISLLSERLGIYMENEMTKLISIKNRLSQWHEAIIMQLNNEIEQINLELESDELIKISDYTHLYELLKVRYLLNYNHTREAEKMIKKIQKKEYELSDFESNLLKHVQGIYYLSNQDFNMAIQTLKQIQIEDYHNPEYYYHLAIAYHTINSPVLAYYYAEKSHKFFKEINNYLRVIDAEMIMIIQITEDGNHEEIIIRFKNLIKSCELCNAPDRKAKVLHNLAYEYYRRKNYVLAIGYYRESMALKNHESATYLLSFESYIRCAFDGNLMPTDVLIKLAEDGLVVAIRLNELLYIHLFRLTIYLLKSKCKEYHQYLAKKALPMYVKYGYSFLIKRSEKELFNYYSKINLPDKALEIAKLLITK